MDPSHLKTDEINYELYIRYVDGIVDKSGRIRTLRNMLQKENQGLVQFPKFARDSISSLEIETCYAKILELKGITQPAIQSGDQQMLEYSKSRFLHLRDRSERISPVTEEEKNELGKIKEAILKWQTAIERNLKGGMVRFDSRGSVLSGLMDFSLGNGETKSPEFGSPKPKDNLGAIGPQVDKSMSSSFKDNPDSSQRVRTDARGELGVERNGQGDKRSAYLPNLHDKEPRSNTGTQKTTTKAYDDVLGGLGLFRPFDGVDQEKDTFQAKGREQVQTTEADRVRNRTFHERRKEQAPLYHRNLFDNEPNRKTQMNDNYRPQNYPNQNNKWDAYNDTQTTINRSWKVEPIGRKEESRNYVRGYGHPLRNDYLNERPYTSRENMLPRATIPMNRHVEPNNPYGMRWDGFDDRYRLEYGNQDRFIDPEVEPEVRQVERNRGRYEFRPNRKYKPVHSWTIKFNGETGLSLMDFIDQAEMLQVAEGISSEELFSSIIHLLSGRAFEWYRSSYRDITTWEEFKQAIREEFIPENYEHMLMWEIETRAQGKNEPFGSYLCAMKRLFQCLSAPLSEEYKLYVVRKGLNGLYAMHLATSNIRSLDELSRLCKRIDSTRMMLHRQKCINVSRDSLLEPDMSFPNKSQPRQVHAITEEQEEVFDEVEAFERKSTGPQVQNVAKGKTDNKTTRPRQTNDSTMTCWNCDTRGHHFNNCRQPRRGLFCFRCGEKNIIMRNCPRCNNSTTAVQDTENPTKTPEAENLDPNQS